VLYYFISSSRFTPIIPPFHLLTATSPHPIPLTRPQGAIPLLIGCARRFEGDLEVAVAALASLRNLANNDESVGQIAREGGLEMAVAALEQHVANAVRVCVGVCVWGGWRAGNESCRVASCLAWRGNEK
jgi:hypothetical protein